ncbi:hypothetical protein Q7P37_000524 [Cladosporium fusiforme]
MKFTAALALLASTAAALPALETRQFGGRVGSTITELEDGACRDVTFIFARGSTERGNIGSTVGPPTCSGLKSEYGSDKVACQGVGGPYRASVGSNALPEGTTRESYGEAQRLFDLAASQCPDTIIVAAGYSQGAAVMTAAVKRLDDSVKDRVAGVVLYGNTRNRQEGGKIPDFPDEKALTFCNASDGVCGGALLVTAGHLTYTRDVGDAVKYLTERISAA